jgi:hypothetical protein
MYQSLWLNKHRYHEYCYLVFRLKEHYSIKDFNAAADGGPGTRGGWPARPACIQKSTEYFFSL